MLNTIADGGIIGCVVSGIETRRLQYLQPTKYSKLCIVTGIRAKYIS